VTAHFAVDAPAAIKISRYRCWRFAVSALPLRAGAIADRDLI